MFQQTVLWLVGIRGVAFGIFGLHEGSTEVYKYLGSAEYCGRSPNEHYGVLWLGVLGFGHQQLSSLCLCH